jgi:hypothetical protein
MDLAPVIARLNAKTELKQVLFGSALQGEDTVVEQFPAVFVAPFKEMAVDEPVEITAYLQMVDQMFEVMIVSSYQSFHAAREAVIDALLGKEIFPGAVTLCRFVEGMQVEGTGTLVYWRDIFAVRKQRRVL